MDESERDSWRDLVERAMDGQPDAKIPVPATVLIAVDAELPGDHERATQANSIVLAFLAGLFAGLVLVGGYYVMNHHADATKDLRPVSRPGQAAR